MSSESLFIDFGLVGVSGDGRLTARLVCFGLRLKTKITEVGERCVFTVIVI